MEEGRCIRKCGIIDMPVRGREERILRIDKIQNGMMCFRIAKIYPSQAFVCNLHTLIHAKFNLVFRDTRIRERDNTKL